MNRNDDGNLSLILSVERIALASRYVVYVLIAPAFMFENNTREWVNFAVVTAVVLLHNAFVHWVFRTGRHYLFRGPLNLSIYLLEASLITFFTGADSSDAYILYFLVLIGFSAYHRRLRLTILVSVLCGVLYGAVLGAEWVRVQSISETPSNLTVRFLFLIVCGWLMGNLSDRLRLSEESVRERAATLADSRASLRAILDSAAEAILVYDEREFITDANDPACEFLGVPREHLLGRRIRSFVFDDGTLPTKFAALRARGELRGEQIFVRADGEERTVDFRVRSYVNEGQRYFVAVAYDITEQKDLQEATRLANANLERLNRELRSVDQLKTAFLATISQKLRSPLSAVLGFVEMTLQEELGEINADQRNALQTCRRATLRVFRLIDEALDLRHREPVEIHFPAHANPRPAPLPAAPPPSPNGSDAAEAKPYRDTPQPIP